MGGKLAERIGLAVPKKITADARENAVCAASPCSAKELDIERVGWPRAGRAIHDHARKRVSGALFGRDASGFDAERVDERSKVRAVGPLRIEVEGHGQNVRGT